MSAEHPQAYLSMKTELGPLATWMVGNGAVLSVVALAAMHETGVTSSVSQPKAVSRDRVPDGWMVDICLCPDQKMH